MAHESSHLEMTKTKQMVRTKYWFPLMNSMIELVNQCYECKVVTKQVSEQPVKPTVIRRKPWETVSVDFGGPYPDGLYNLVIIGEKNEISRS